MDKKSFRVGVAVIDRFNPKVTVNTCGILQKHIETMTFVKSVMGHFSKIEPKTSKKDIKNG